MSAAFIRELLRKATLLAIEDSGQAVVAQRHLQEALDDLTVAGGQVTRNLPGVRQQEAALSQDADRRANAARRKLDPAAVRHGW